MTALISTKLAIEMIRLDKACFDTDVSATDLCLTVKKLKEGKNSVSVCACTFCHLLKLRILTTIIMVKNVSKMFLDVEMDQL